MERDLSEWRRQRLAALAEKRGGKAALGRMLGYKDGAFIGQMIRGERPITEKTIDAWSMLLPGIEEWFKLANGDSANVPAPLAGAPAYLPGFEKLSIPLLANSGSMGAGDDQLHDEVVIGRLTVSPEWALKTLRPTKLEHLRFIHGYGDSMKGTFEDGDILLVDTGVEEPKIDGVYVLEANERIYIKRVRQRLDGEYEISSDNPNVRTVDVLDGRREVKVRGRVVWAWNGKKL